VYAEVYAMRTNIFIDDEIISRAMDISGIKTKKDVVNRALHEFVLNNSKKNLLELKGQIRFSDGYDYKALREGKHVDIG
jgi:Arc/MetJ family transcription regulator